MQLYPMSTLKVIVLNDDKSRGVTLEYPQDMKMGELLDKIDFLEAEVKKAHLKELEKEKVDAEKKEDKKDSKVEEMPKAEEPKADKTV